MALLSGSDGAGEKEKKGGEGGEEDEEEEEETCGFCKFMKGGPCKKVFVVRADLEFIQHINK